MCGQADAVARSVSEVIAVAGGLDDLPGGGVSFAAAHRSAVAGGGA